jgi:hypothetical protein
MRLKQTIDKKVIANTHLGEQKKTAAIEVRGSKSATSCTLRNEGNIE